jgi:hypothetical protein
MPTAIPSSFTIYQSSNKPPFFQRATAPKLKILQPKLKTFTAGVTDPKMGPKLGVQIATPFFNFGPGISVLTDDIAPLTTLDIAKKTTTIVRKEFIYCPV